MSLLLGLNAANERRELKRFTASTDNQMMKMEKMKSRAEVFNMSPRGPLRLLEGFRGAGKNKTTVIVSTMNELPCGFRRHISL